MFLYNSKRVYIKFELSYAHILKFISIHILIIDDKKYFVVERESEKVLGPYSTVQEAKTELKEVAKNGKCRLIVEVINNVVIEDPTKIDGLDQTPANGFEKYWNDWWDINAMVKIVKPVVKYVVQNKGEIKSFVSFHA